MKKLISDDQALAIEGTSRSDNTEAAFNYLKQLDAEGSPVVLLSPASASPGLGAITKWGFRNSFFESKVYARVIDVLKGFGYTTAGTYVSKDNGFDAAIYKGMVVPTLQKDGFKIVAATEGLEKDTDYSSQISQLRQANPDIVAIATPVLPGVSLMKEGMRRGFDPRSGWARSAISRPRCPSSAARP